MGVMEFIGRQIELGVLADEYASPAPALVVVYGRRRVGKSRLIQEAAKGRPNVYFQATKVEPSANLAQFQAEIAQSLGADPRIEGISDWTGTLRFLARHAAEKAQGLVVMLDEFPYLVDGYKALPSVLQKFWDSGVAEAGALKLVLCGSAIAQMESLQAESNPLYGRKTRSLDVGPLPLRDAANFFPEWPDEDKVTAYAIFGGIPHYLRAIDPRATLGDNVLRLLFTPSGRFVEEPTNILQSEVGRVNRYSSIISAIAHGLNTGSQISNRIPETKATSGVSSYLETLTGLRILRRENSMDATPRERDSRYVVADPMMAFWHRFVLPNASAVARDAGAEVMKRQVRPKLSEYMGGAFEEICREHARSYLQELTGVPAQLIGQEWGHAGFDLDVAGFDLDGNAIFGECKWTNAAVDRSVLEKLRGRAEAARFPRGATGRVFLLYARGGFTDDVLAQANVDPTLHLVDLAGLLYARQPVPRDEPAQDGASEPSPW
ncbi:AAA family ATPase [Methylorubrum extorquens]|uniref:AAA family ATPase n=1 Tax=Methylorubrum extorquens TaxID=408 RepID=UPI001EE531A9|nr:ATP-binding protein [Methylorubrum extorquens]MCG5249509.1 ATP-binding protein [Methylorubrum extorquens]